MAEPQLPIHHPEPTTLGVAIVLAIEVAAILGLLYTARYTLVHRSGLNDPEKLQRIWRRSEEIRFQPVFNSMAFSVAVGYGAPSALAGVILSVIGIILPNIVFRVVVLIVALCVVISTSAVTPIVYRVSGGTRIRDNIIAMFTTVTVMTWLLFYDIVPLISEHAKASKTVVWAFLIFSSVVGIIIQIPGVIYGIRVQVPDTAQRIYSPTLAPEFNRISQSVLLAFVPIALAVLLEKFTQVELGAHYFFAKAASLLSEDVMYLVCAIASVISVNRGLLAEDFRWQWRAFLTSAVPVGAMELVSAIYHLFKNGVIISGLALTVQRFCMAGAWGTIGVFLYLKYAEAYARTQLGDLDDDIPEHEELFGSDLSDNDATPFEA